MRALVVISAGFAETGAEGAERQEQLLALVREHGARLLGPNCLGIASTAVSSQRDLRAAQLPAREDRVLVPERRARARLARAGGGDRPRGHLVRVDRQQGRRLLERPARVVGGRRRDRDGRPLPRVVRQPTRVLTHRAPGRAPQADPCTEGRERRAPAVRAAGSHTAALAGSDAAVDALFRQAGVIRARTLDELIDVATLLSAQPVPRGRRVALRHQCRRARHPRRGRLRGRRARAALAERRDASCARRGHAGRGKRRESDRHARRRPRGELCAALPSVLADPPSTP